MTIQTLLDLSDLCDIPTHCPECSEPIEDCGSFFFYKKNNSPVVDGRLTMHDIGVDLILGCDDCGKTIAVIPYDLVAARIKLVIS